MRRRDRERILKEAGLEQEDIQSLTREMQEGLVHLFMLAAFWEGLVTMARFGEALKKMTDTLQGKDQPSTPHTSQGEEQ